MTITKNSLIMMIFFLTIKHCLAQSANSQQPTANISLTNQNNILFYNTKSFIEESSLGNFLCDSFALQIIRRLLFFVFCLYRKKSFRTEWFYKNFKLKFCHRGGE